MPKKRPLRKSELRYVLFHVDQWKDAPDRIKSEGKLHIGRATVKGAIVIACTGEAHFSHHHTFDAYPFFKWFKDAGAPICGKCERVVLEDIEQNGLED